MTVNKKDPGDFSVVAKFGRMFPDNGMRLGYGRFFVFWASRVFPLGFLIFGFNLGCFIYLTDKPPGLNFRI